MKIAIVGAGISGIATAYELAAEGHAVTVFEGCAAAAEEASFAPAGVLSSAAVTAWASPHLPRPHLHWPLNRRELAWLAHQQAQRQRSLMAIQGQNLQQLARYSQQRLQHLSQALGLKFEQTQGYTVLLRSAQEHQQVQPTLDQLRAAGTRFLELDPVATRALEPALSRDCTLVGAIHLPDSNAGNCRQFALLLRRQAEQMGAQFHFNSRVHRLLPGQRPQLLRQGSNDPESFDAVLLCAGATSAALLRPLNLRLPLAAVYGYSISLPLDEPLNAPRSALLDLRHQVTITRLGHRVRVSGGCELGGRASPLRPAALHRLHRVLHHWFPGAVRHSANFQPWRGARPTLADGLPLLGPSGRAGIWLNLGHGNQGWALACACARAVADAMIGNRPAMDLKGLSIERFS